MSNNVPAIPFAGSLLRQYRHVCAFFGSQRGSRRHFPVYVADLPSGRIVTFELVLPLLEKGS